MTNVHTQPPGALHCAHRAWRALPTEESTVQVCRHRHKHTGATSLMCEAPRLHHRYVLQLHYMEEYSQQHELTYLENSTSKTHCKGGGRSTTIGWGRRTTTEPFVRMLLGWRQKVMYLLQPSSPDESQVIEWKKEGRLLQWSAEVKKMITCKKVVRNFLSKRWNYLRIEFKY